MRDLQKPEIGLLAAGGWCEMLLGGRDDGVPVMRVGFVEALEWVTARGRSGGHRGRGGRGG